jgi:site-specific DNA-cytosine methylase
MDGDPGNLRHRPYTALFVFSGIGGAALGFKRAQVDFRAFGLRAGFKILGGIDIDPGTATDFERLTGAPCLAMDVCQITPALLREWFGDEAPDVVVFSPPCKQASGLLSKARAETEAYRKLGALAGVWMRLMLETWPEGPRIVVMENVPRIRTRAPEVMRDVRRALRGMGYLFHEESHDLGELGGLAQHRDRLLVMARHKDRVPALIYKPSPRRVRGVGEVLGELPMPGDPAAGPLHKLPALEFITALRLALIPAGGDWHDLPPKVLLPPELAALLKRRLKPSERTPFNDVWRVVRWDDPAGCVTAGNTPSAGGMSVADPRVKVKCMPHTYGVVRWDRPSHTITGNAAPGGGPFSVADPRVGRTNPEKARNDDHGVIAWDSPSGTITGNGTPSTGRFAVADPRITCKTRENSAIYGVIPWTEASGTVVGHACHDNGRFSVADPRWHESVPFPVIISEDGTIHRPLTILERAVLQSFRAKMDDGSPLTLTGKNSGDWSVRVGDAIPPDAFERVGEQLLMTLVNAEVGSFSLSSGGGVWVEQRRMSFGAETPCEGRA